MEIIILNTENVLAKICIDWYWNKLLFGFESYCYCGTGEFFVHIGCLKIAIVVLTKTSTDDPLDQFI